MIDILIATGAIALGLYGFARRRDWTMGSLLGVLLVSIPITYNMPGKGWTVTAMGALEFVLACCMTACWCRWVSMRARAVLALCIVKFLLVCTLAFDPISAGQWQNTILTINALLVAQIVVAGGMGDAVVWLLDRLDPSGARDRDMRSHRLGT